MKTVIDTLIQRNEAFRNTRVSSELKIMPSLKTNIIGCVDPNDIFDLWPGEAAVICDVDGRIFPSTLQTLGMLGAVAKANGGATGEGWNLVVLHDTDYGIKSVQCAGVARLALWRGLSEGRVSQLTIRIPRWLSISPC